MAGHLHAIVWYNLIVFTFINAACLWLQLRTYRRTGHRSLAFLVISTIFGLASGFLIMTALVHAGDKAFLSAIYLTVDVFSTLQCVIGLWGVASLFKAFEALVRTQSFSGEAK